MTRTTLLAGGAAAVAAATLLIVAPTALAQTPTDGASAPVSTDAPAPPGDCLAAPAPPTDGTPPAPPAPGELPAPPADGEAPVPPTDGSAPVPPAAGELPALPDGEAPAPPCGPVAPPVTEAATVESTVASYHSGPDGTVDGLVLADGTEVPLPPDAGVSAESFAIGAPLRIEGDRHTTPTGATHLHPTTITDAASGAVTTVTRPEPPQPR